MIQYDTKVWFRHIVKFSKIDTFRRLLWEMIIVGAYAGALAYVEIEHLQVSGDSKIANTTVVHSILGFALSLMLVFRTNTAYDRWWEGRKQWGALVNNVRNFAIKIETWVPKSRKEDREFYKVMISNFPYAFKEHLRGKVKEEELDDVEGVKAKLMTKDHVPNEIARQLYARTKTLVDEEVISKEEFITLDKELKSLTDILGACERILKTPIPYTYNIFLKKFILIYIATLPLGFIILFGYWAVPVTIFVFYVLVSLELIAEEIENPFGLDPNDLPLDDMSDTMKKNVKEIFEA